MVQEWLAKGVFLYLMAGICGAGILLKIILAGYFDRQVRRTRSMDGVKKKWLLGMCQDYEDCVGAHGRMNNVDIFVDKYIEGKKFMGIMLSTWDKISGQAWILCAGLLVVAAVSGIFYEVDREAILFTFFIGTWTVIVDIVVDNIANLDEKKNQLKRNLKDYFENRAGFAGNEELSGAGAERMPDSFSEYDAPEDGFGGSAELAGNEAFSRKGVPAGNEVFSRSAALAGNEAFSRSGGFSEEDSFAGETRGAGENGSEALTAHRAAFGADGADGETASGETGPKLYVVNGKEKNAVGAQENTEKKARRESKKEMTARKKREHIKRELKQEMAEQKPQEESAHRPEAKQEPAGQTPSREAVEQLAAALELLKKENSLGEAGALLAAQIGRDQENGALIEEVLREFLI